MTTKLEEQFFKTFGIEQKTNGCEEYFYMPDAESCKECEDKPCLKHLEYPQITDRKLLAMICIYNSTYTNGFTNYSLLNERSTEELKGHILRNCLKVRDDVKHQIQQLFKEGE